MKKIVSTTLAVIASISIAGCNNVSNQDVGTASGAAIGGLLGSQFGHGGGQLLAVGAGALAGALIGGSIGKNMDQTDQLKMQQTFESNQTGQPAYWKNSSTGNSYTVTPVKNVTVNHNKYCREYRTTANIAGKNQQVYGTACRQPDGSWKIIK